MYEMLFDDIRSDLNAIFLLKNDLVWFKGRKMDCKLYVDCSDLFEVYKKVFLWIMTEPFCLIALRN